jgi:hypothetical protein
LIMQDRLPGARLEIIWPRLGSPAARAAGSMLLLARPDRLERSFL